MGISADNSLNTYHQILEKNIDNYTKHKQLKKFFVDLFLHEIPQKVAQEILKKHGPTHMEFLEKVFTFAQSYFARKHSCFLLNCFSHDLQSFHRHLKTFQQAKHIQEQLFFLEIEFFHLGHFLTIDIQKNLSCVEINIFDALGRDIFLMINAKILKTLVKIFPDAKIVISKPCRQKDYDSCWIFALWDALQISKLRENKQEIMAKPREISFEKFLFWQLVSFLGNIVKMFCFPWKFLFFFKNACLIGKSIIAMTYVFWSRKSIFSSSIAYQMMRPTQSCLMIEKSAQSEPLNVEKYYRVFDGKKQNHFCTVKKASLLARYLLADLCREQR